MNTPTHLMLSLATLTRDGESGERKTYLLPAAAGALVPDAPMRPLAHTPQPLALVLAPNTPNVVPLGLVASPWTPYPLRLSLTPRMSVYSIVSVRRSPRPAT